MWYSYISYLFMVDVLIFNKTGSLQYEDVHQAGLVCGMLFFTLHIHSELVQLLISLTDWT